MGYFAITKARNKLQEQVSKILRKNGEIDEFMFALDAYIEVKLDDLQDKIQQRGEYDPDY